MNFVKWYGRKLETHPLTAKCTTSFITFSLGDILCQHIVNINKNESFDYTRLAKITTFGVIITPWFHANFSIIIPYLFNKPGMLNTIKAVAYDQIINAPIFMSTFFGYYSVVDGKSYSQYKARLREALIPTLIANWSYWPFVMAINFSFVPHHFRVLFTNICGILWNIYLSYVENNKYANLKSDK